LFPERATPVVIWHGLGQSCCDPLAIGRVKSVIANTTKAYVVSIKVSPEEQSTFICNNKGRLSR
jgi:hypothetical protein